MRLSIRPFGVLGTVMTPGGVRKVAQGPAPGLAVLDPAGLPFIRSSGPRGAGGAAGQIYQWLNIAEHDAFPAPVRNAIRAPLQAKLHYYGTKACLHVVGPNFSSRNCSRDEALGELEEAYSAVLREFAGSKLGGLRLLPISGSTFAGPFAPELPTLTCSALRRAFDALPDRAQHIVSVARLDMCIFVESEYKLYAEAFEKETDMAQEFADSLGMGHTPTQPWQTGR